MDKNILSARAKRIAKTSADTCISCMCDRVVKASGDRLFCHTYTQTRTCKRALTYTRAQTHACTRTQIHAHTHTRSRTCPCGVRVSSLSCSVVPQKIHPLVFSGFFFVLFLLPAAYTSPSKRETKTKPPPKVISRFEFSSCQPALRQYWTLNE